jgi:hypothetical protein
MIKVTSQLANKMMIKNKKPCQQRQQRQQGMSLWSLSLQMASDRNRVKSRNGNGYNKEFQQNYYSKNRDWILEKIEVYKQD